MWLPRRAVRHHVRHPHQPAGGQLAIGFALTVGITIGLVAGYLGGAVDSLLMRIADIQLTFPAILIALLVDGVVARRAAARVHDRMELYVLVLAIGIARWPQFARTVRGSTHGGARQRIRHGGAGDRLSVGQRS